MKPRLLASFAALAFLFGCASSEVRFKEILTGMTQQEVKTEMGEGPARFEKSTRGNYSAWYWGDDDYCILFRNQKVVYKKIRKPARCPVPVS